MRTTRSIASSIVIRCPRSNCLRVGGGTEQALQADAGIGFTDQLGEADGRPNAIALAQAVEGAHDQRPPPR